ncbi:MAG: hypothetical protein E7161_03615 [Firmicutes bacterium]|nr:hypothetical protein [Bacillota bacterium]
MGTKKQESNELEENKIKQVKLKSEMYNHDNEKIARRDDETNEAMMWGFVIGFALFFVLLIVIIVFVN